MRYTYDNSAANPRNPHVPPQRIVWGQNTSNEMGDLWLQVVPRTSDDLSILNADIGRKMRREDIAANVKLLEADPANPTRHDRVAVLLLQDGQGAQAIPYLRASLRLRPEYAPAHYNLGLALTAGRQFEDAIREYREAIRIDPRHADAHNSLGALLHAWGNLYEAIGHYRIAAALAGQCQRARQPGTSVVRAGADIRRTLEEFRARPFGSIQTRFRP
jgi:tetratricopeptide (TPR) repeat protein